MLATESCTFEAKSCSQVELKQDFWLDISSSSIFFLKEHNMSTQEFSSTRLDSASLRSYMYELSCM